MTLSRRQLLISLAASALWPHAAAAAHEDFAVAMQALETRSGTRIGVAALDTGTQRGLAWRAGERFAMCSTFKLLLAAQVLSRIERGEEHGDRLIRYDDTALLGWAPLTRAQQHSGMRIDALCAAAITHSDNTAANLLLDASGGPAALTAWLRRLGDDATRLDRIEPTLNTAIPGDPRDTTTPLAMLLTMQRLLLCTVLQPASREQLIGWMLSCTTGADRLRAGLPSQWRVGDKTGSGEHGAVNDVAIVWPPGRAPWLIAAYTVGEAQSAAQGNRSLAAIAQQIHAAYTSEDARA